MNTDRSQTRSRFAVALVVALVLQVPLLGLLYWQAKSESTPQVRKRAQGMVARLAPRPKPKPTEEKPFELDGQVVELPDPPKPEPEPEEAKYLAKENQRTEKETKAIERTSKPVRRRTKVKVEDPSPVQSPDSDTPRPTELPEMPMQAELPRPQEKMPESDLGHMAPERDSPARDSPHLLMPSTSRKNAMANIQAMSGISASDDALLEVEEEADDTALDAKKFRYWDFFNRVKERVRGEWSPSLVYQRHDPTGRIHGVRDRLTVLKVTLDSRGNMVSVDTVKNSGLDFLDREARRSMRAASPFTNPPAGLADARGLIEFQFGFMYEISRGRPKFFWKRM